MSSLYEILKMNA